SRGDHPQRLCGAGRCAGTPQRGDEAAAVKGRSPFRCPSLRLQQSRHISTRSSRCSVQGERDRALASLRSVDSTRASALRDAHFRKSRMLSAISRACVSKAKWPVSKKRTTAGGLSRLNASAPGGKKNGSFLPHTARSGGLCVRKYCWKDG